MKGGFLFWTLALVAGAPAQTNVHLKDGRIVSAKQLRREKDTIIATLEIPATEPGAAPTRGDFGFPLQNIFKLEFPRPAVLDTCPELIATGKADEALGKLDPAIKYYAAFRDAPGSWWPDLVPLQVGALLALRREKEAADAALQFRDLAADPETKKFAKAFSAVALTCKGEHQASLALYDAAALATDRVAVLGLIAVKKGDSLAALADALQASGETEAAAERYEEALLSFLRVPALYRSQRLFLPQAAFGAARAYLGLRDFDRARQSLKELTTSFAATPEAKAAVELSAKIEKTASLTGAPRAETH